MDGTPHSYVDDVRFIIVEICQIAVCYIMHVVSGGAPYQDFSLPGVFAPGAKVPSGNLCSQERKFPGTFAPAWERKVPEPCMFHSEHVKFRGLWFFTHNWLTVILRGGRNSV